MLDAFPERFEFGCLQINPPFSEKEKFVKKFAHHCLISRVNEEIDSFKKGLSTSGVLEIFQRHKKESLPLLIYNENLLTAERLKSVFMPSYSDSEEERIAEVDIYFNWINFIDEVENSSITYTCLTLEDLENQQMADGNYKAALMKLSDIMIFLSGSRYLNKEVQIKVIFTRTASGRLYVSNCRHEITFPVNER